MLHVDHTEVLVVGAGPVGMLTALALARKGIHTRIIDKESTTAGHSYACALHPGSLELLEELGIAKEAVERGWRIETVHYHEGIFPRARLSLSELASKFPYALVVEQCAFEDLLEKKLKEAGVKVEWRHQLEELEANDHGATATLCKLAPRGSGYGVPNLELAVEKRTAVSADYIIGADGANSLVRRQMGIEFEKAAAPAMYAVFEMETNMTLGHEMVVMLGGGLSSVMWPLGEHKGRWSFQVSPSALPDDFPSKDRERFVVQGPAGEEDVQHQFARLLKERTLWTEEDIAKVYWNTRVQFEHRLVQQFGRAHCWLVGDAAHQTGPVGMQSMNLGLREGADLAETLHGILRGGAPMESLQTYDAKQRAQWRRILWTEGSLQSRPSTPSWVWRQPLLSIVSSLPAGEELGVLMRGLGLEFTRGFYAKAQGTGQPSFVANGATADKGAKK